MVWMRLENVGVEFPIYGRRMSSGRVRANVGGEISPDARSRASISALRQVSLDLKEGDRIGLIGGNGAGKTTLLRVMAGIYEPTAGSVTTRGTVVALLGGALGMDMELPGYENIMLRGRMLGLTRKEIMARMDDIMAFTELEDFLHLPMRTYSAGMRLRLAFAITTSVDADILLLDEAVGAGDDAFKAKAQARLNRFIERAGILVLATHSTALMTQFCDQALWLDHGEMKKRGPVNDVIAAYKQSGAPQSKVDREAERRRRWRRRRQREKAAKEAAKAEAAKQKVRADAGRTETESQK